MPQLVNQYNEPKIWSGGTTTELFIYPEGATYEDRNFKFRLSTATVESETSEFTPLAGVKRTLMVLHGELSLKHEGQYEKQLMLLQKDQFDGGWKTSSSGICIDFNLMCRGNTSGSLVGFNLKKKEKKVITYTGALNFLYVHQGCIEVNRSTYYTGALIQMKKAGQFPLKASESTILVLIQLKNL